MTIRNQLVYFQVYPYSLYFRLEARMQILEDHNRQLEAQLQRLRQLLDEPSTSTLQTRSVTASQLNQDNPGRVSQPPPPADHR